MEVMRARIKQPAACAVYLLAEPSPMPWLQKVLVLLWFGIFSLCTRVVEDGGDRDRAAVDGFGETRLLCLLALFL